MAGIKTFFFFFFSCLVIVILYPLNFLFPLCVCVCDRDDSHRDSCLITQTVLFPVRATSPSLPRLPFLPLFRKRYDLYFPKKTPLVGSLHFCCYTLRSNRLS